MKWEKITIETTTEATDMLSYTLGELGIEGIEVEDHVPLSEEDRKKMYVDLLPDEIAPDDGKARISCYVEEDTDMDALVKKIASEIDSLREFIDVGSGKITLGQTEDKDWINNWKQYFKPFRLDENIIIKPTWETCDMATEDDIILEIDPGTAFGTGSHETTKLCISQIKKYMPKKAQVLDVGTGSGILSILALKLGAEHAVATDIDENAIIATHENMEVNHISEHQLEAYQGNVLDDMAFCEKLGFEKYDIVVANILADVIIPLSSIARKFMKKDAYFITSGIINTKKEEVKDAMEKNGFEIVDIIEMGEWVSIVGK